VYVYNVVLGLLADSPGGKPTCPCAAVLGGGWVEDKWAGWAHLLLGGGWAPYMLNRSYKVLYINCKVYEICTLA